MWTWVVLTSSPCCDSPELLSVVFTGLPISSVLLVFLWFQLLAVIHILSCLWVKVPLVHLQLLLSTWNAARVQWIFVKWELADGHGESAAPLNNKSKVASTEVTPASVWIPVLCSWPCALGCYGAGDGDPVCILYELRAQQRREKVSEGQDVMPDSDWERTEGQTKDGRNSGCVSPGTCRPWENAMESCPDIKRTA